MGRRHSYFLAVPRPMATLSIIPMVRDPWACFTFSLSHSAHRCTNSLHMRFISQNWQPPPSDVDHFELSPNPMSIERPHWYLDNWLELEGPFVDFGTPHLVIAIEWNSKLPHKPGTPVDWNFNRTGLGFYSYSVKDQHLCNNHHVSPRWVDELIQVQRTASIVLS